MDSLESLFSLRGRVGFVTGASSGLGVDCAIALAMAGADVALAARRGERLERLAADIAREFGVRTAAIPLDVTSDEQIDAALARARQELGLVDILVNNAGISPTGRAENLPRATWDAAIATNLTAPMMLAQRVARALIDAKRPGRIINMVSIYATVASSIYRLSAYTAAKAGLLNLTRQLAVEWAGYGILVNALAPGWIPTEATEAGIAKGDNRERMERWTPLGRLGRPEEIRGPIIFLASAASSYVTGAMLSVDGGYQAW
ncbi:MAG TPA: SDR family oxidoreductase [Candidatus Binataceae bacterium]|nr:SDR family oxidoreductase [Candidatus Binataceae bacterium]